MFGIEHPYWQQAIELRKQDFSLAAIVAEARREGHRLTASEVNYGLRHAPADLGIASRDAYVMRRRHALTQPDLDALTTMRDLVLEALMMVERMEEELSVPRMRADRRLYLEQQHEKWIKTAFTWARAVAEVENVPLGGGSPDTSPPARRGDVLRTLGRQLLGDLQARLPAPPLDQLGLGAIYGTENVRPPDLTLTADNDDRD